MKQLLSFLSKYSLFIIFTAFILIFTVVDIITPYKEFSELENKKLPQAPKLTLKTLINNDFTMDYEEYINGQFLLRDNWLTLKAVADAGFAKISSSRVLLGKHNYLFAQNFNYDTKKFENNLNEIKKYQSKYGNTKVMLVPSAYTIYPELLPSGAEVHMAKQAEQIEKAKAMFGAENVIDVTDALKSNRDKYIYYRTDHHWTTDGAYFAYRELIKNLGMEPVELSEIAGYRKEVEDFKGTNYRKWQTINTKPDTISYYDLPIDSFKINHKSDIETSMYGVQKIDNLYMEDAFKHSDKYEAFLYGNNGLSIIKSTVNPAAPKSILVIKDSYANCLVPFLTRHFDTVAVVDPRSLTPTNLRYLASQKYDERLVLFSLEGFQDESNIFRINM